MAAIQYRRIAVSGIRKDLADVFRPAAERMTGIIITAGHQTGDPDGKLDSLTQPQRADLIDKVGDVVTALFINAERKSFDRDGVTALTPYAAFLNRRYVDIVYQSVKVHHDWMRRRVPEDVRRWLGQRGRKIQLEASRRPPAYRRNVLREADNPFLQRPDESLADFKQRMADLRLFSPNPLATYDPMHTWVDPNGYVLSRRIWRVEAETRSKMERLLADLIGQGVGALEIARQMEQFLMPGRAKLRTHRPYGTDASADAMRLARSEIARAANQAAFLAASMNPYVDKIDVARSANGDAACTICPQHATIGIGGDRIRDPYVLSEARLPIYHPNCVTPGQIVQTLRGNIPIEQVKEGNFVLTHTGNYRRVLEAWSRHYEGYVHDIITDSGHFELTSEHPVLTSEGWLDAQFVEVGQQVRYTSIDISHDLFVRVPESQPTEAAEVAVSASIPFCVVPYNPITLDSDTAGNQSEIQHISPYAIFALENQFAAGEGFEHGTFNRVGFPVTPHLEQFVPTDNQPWIMSLLRFRDFASNIRPFSWIIVPVEIETAAGDFESLTSGSGSCTVVALPLCPYTVTMTTELITAQMHQVAEHAVGDVQPFANFGITEGVGKIEAVQYADEWQTEFFFNSQTMPFDFGDVVRTNMVSGILQEAPTDRAGESSHNNLLSLSPDLKAGAASGNAVVERVANPPQALVHYSAVRRVNTRWYSGLVYNMHVEGDNSYTVNGAAVHNCMCRVQSVVNASPADITAKLRAVMQNAEQQQLEPFVTPLTIRAFLDQILGQPLMALLLQSIQLPLI